MTCNGLQGFQVNTFSGQHGQVGMSESMRRCAIKIHSFVEPAQQLIANRKSFLYHWSITWDAETLQEGFLANRFRLPRVKASGRWRQAAAFA